MKTSLIKSLIAGVVFLGVISLLNIAVLPLILSSSYAINSLVVTFYTFLITAPLAFLVGGVSWWGCSKLRPLWKYALLGMVCCACLFLNINFYPMEDVNEEDRLPSLEEFLRKQ